MKEAIKISVEVSVNLSESTQNFIKSLFTCSCKPLGVAEVKEEPKAVEVKEEPKAVEVKEEPKAVEVKEEPKAVEVKEEVPQKSKTIEEVRDALSKKVNDHRDTIKQKLNSLGAPSVTKLDPSKYNEMYEFLMTL